MSEFREHIRDSKNNPSTNLMANKRVTSNPELNLPDKDTIVEMSSKLMNVSHVSPRQSSSTSSPLSDRSRRDIKKRRSTVCLSVPTRYVSLICNSKRRSSLPTTSHKFYYSGPTLQLPPISYSKLCHSSSSSGNDMSFIKSLRCQKQDIGGSDISKCSFSTQKHITSSSNSSDVQSIPQISSTVKRQSSGSITSFSSHTESYAPSAGSSNSTSAITSSSSSSYEVPEHRSSCASIHSYSGMSTHGSSKCFSIDSRRSSAATDTWNRSTCSGITSTRSR